MYAGRVREWEHDLPVCTDRESDAGKTFYPILGRDEDALEDEVRERDDSPPPVKANSFKEAILSLEDSRSS